MTDGSRRMGWWPPFFIRQCSSSVIQNVTPGLIKYDFISTSLFQTGNFAAQRTFIINNSVALQTAMTTGSSYQVVSFDMGDIRSNIREFIKNQLSPKNPKGRQKEIVCKRVVWNSDAIAEIADAYKLYQTFTQMGLTPLVHHNEKMVAIEKFDPRYEEIVFKQKKPHKVIPPRPPRRLVDMFKEMKGLATIQSFVTV